MPVGGAQKGRGKKLLGIARISQAASDRAGASRHAAAFPASCSRWARHVIGAGFEIEPVGLERIDRTHSQAGLCGAAVTRAWNVIPGRNFDPLGEQERGAVDMPQAVFRVDHDPRGRAVDRVGAHRPILDRDKRRAFIGQDRMPVHCVGRRENLRFQPAIERIARVGSRTGGFKRRPKVAARIAGQQNRRGGRAVGQGRDRIGVIRIKPAPEKEPGRFQRS